jgi:hypothetical protein
MRRKYCLPDVFMVRRQIRVYKHLGGAVNGRQRVAQIVQN